MILLQHPLGVCCENEQRPDHCSLKGELAQPEEGEGSAGDSGSGSGGTEKALGAGGAGGSQACVTQGTLGGGCEGVTGRRAPLAVQGP